MEVQGAVLLVHCLHARIVRGAAWGCITIAVTFNESGVSAIHGYLLAGIILVRKTPLAMRFMGELVERLRGRADHHRNTIGPLGAWRASV